LSNLNHDPRPLLDLIARHESESAASKQGVASGYDVVVWQAWGILKPNPPLTSMTVAQVLQWQLDAIRAYRAKNRSRGGYSAAGRYQIIRSTLQSLIDSDWKLTDLYDRDTQDLLGLQLLRRRGWDRWRSGRMPGGDQEFADSLSKEWASLPFRTGRSYYDKDGHGNRSLVSRAEVLGVLKAIRESAQE
jgi:hypothetical protein